MGITKQRQHILEIIQEHPEHYTAEDIYIKVVEQIPNIGVGTVYRNLNILADQGIIKRIFIPNEPVRYDRNNEQHDHIVCVKCGKIEDIPQVNIDPSKIPQMSGHKVLYHALVVYTVCEDCKLKFCNLI